MALGYLAFVFFSLSEVRYSRSVECAASQRCFALSTTPSLLKMLCVHERYIQSYKSYLRPRGVRTINFTFIFSWIFVARESLSCLFIEYISLYFHFFETESTWIKLFSV